MSLHHHDLSLLSSMMSSCACLLEVGFYWRNALLKSLISSRMCHNAQSVNTTPNVCTLPLSHITNGVCLRLGNLLLSLEIIPKQIGDFFMASFRCSANLIGNSTLGIPHESRGSRSVANDRFRGHSGCIVSPLGGNNPSPVRKNIASEKNSPESKEFSCMVPLSIHLAEKMVRSQYNSNIDVATFLHLGIFSPSLNSWHF